MKILKTLKIVSAIAVLLMATTVSAHVDLTETVPADEAMLMQSPTMLKLTFSGPVRMMKLSLTDAEKNAVKFGFTPSATTASEFEWPLPSFKSGNYQVSWIVMGEDGHKMSGDYGFMFHGDMKMDVKQPASHNSHQH
ncbi:copper resistance protein CopC [Rheinheimera sp. D18]|uniref:copper resistance CopC family protein n=1 Tax=Rheinheimera sp. D18 TaxID=2545632 RepID=UPI001048883C|nr:copper resistance CopC family protein [Rheinheimera sp. D18]QBL09645.1 copper resistance protein CopC [Rheinheimera sp. D18]